MFALISVYNLLLAGFELSTKWTIIILVAVMLIVGMLDGVIFSKKRKEEQKEFFIYDEEENEDSNETAPLNFEQTEIEQSEENKEE